MKRREMTLHMIGNAHLDPVWLWQWQEGFHAAWATLRSALDRMKEDPNFVFTCSQAAIYEWIEQADSHMFEEIKLKIKEGKWNVAGGWWVEPDCNIPSGESFVRQGLYAQRYFKEKFEVLADTGYNIDSFGHNAMLPQILKKCRMENYVFMRPGAHENSNLPDIFWWESPDGSKVLTYRIPYAYNIDKDHLEEVSKLIADMAPKNISDMMVFYGIGNHGGGPTKESLTKINEMINNPNMPQIKFSSPSFYFRQIRTYNPTLPEVKGDLQHHASGCYSVNSQIKVMNRKSEQILTTTEKFSTIVHIMFEKIYPHEEITRAWKNMLFNQFHDILAGTSIKEAYEDATYFYGESLKLAQENLNYALNTIIKNIDTEGKGIPLIVFNQLSWERNAPIEFEVSNTIGKEDSLKAIITDNEGNIIPSQFIKTSATIGNGRLCMVFVDKLPSIGYKLYRLFLGETVENQSSVSVTKERIENSFYRLEIDTNRGWIKSFFDKVHNREILKGLGGIPIVIYDPSDTWSHGVFKFKEEVGRFTDAEIKIIEQGPVRARLRIKSFYNNSTLTQDLIMYNELDYVECRIKINWQERHKMLKISFPVNIFNPVATYEIPYGYLQRPVDGVENPGQQWIDITDVDKSYGLTIATDSCYSFSIEGNDMRLTLLRSPIYAQHDPHKPVPGEEYDYTDQGIHEFRYILYPHKGDWKQSKTVRYAHGLNAPVSTILDTWHRGTMSAYQSFLSIDAENIEATVIKLSEDKDGVILRCYETSGQNIVTDIIFSPLSRKWTTHFEPYEIKTFKIPFDSNKEITEIDMLEMES